MLNAHHSNDTLENYIHFYPVISAVKKAIPYRGGVNALILGKPELLLIYSRLVTSTALISTAASGCGKEIQQ